MALDLTGETFVPEGVLTHIESTVISDNVIISVELRDEFRKALPRLTSDLRHKKTDNALLLLGPIVKLMRYTARLWTSRFAARSFSHSVYATRLSTGQCRVDTADPDAIRKVAMVIMDMAKKVRGMLGDLSGDFVLPADYPRNDQRRGSRDQTKLQPTRQAGAERTTAADQG